jgi:glutamate 5-kinase
MATKLHAARVAAASGISVVMASGKEQNVLLRLLEGESIGTYFPATSSKMESRKRWMLSGLSTRGEIVVDDGAAAVLRDRQRSLLPAGVKGVKGPFNRGDIISITDASSVQIACGITNYASHEVSRIMGIHSGQIAETLGHQYGEEVVHRSNMVVL